MLVTARESTKAREIVGRPVKTLVVQGRGSWSKKGRKRFAFSLEDILEAKTDWSLEAN